MRTRLLFILLFLCLSVLHGQRETSNWFFGEFAGVNFNEKPPVGQKGSLDSREGCASISSRKGDLLFYTDGVTVWDRKHQLMSNDTLFGNPSSTQSAIIVPNPGNKKKYYIFTVDNAEKNEPVKSGLNYAEVDMRLNNGLGGIVQETKNTHLVTYSKADIQQKWKSSEKIAAIIHGDERSYWVITHFVDTFYAFRIDENGVSSEPVKSKVNEIVNVVEYQSPTVPLSNISALGYLKISPNGEKIAIVHSSTRTSVRSGKVYLYNFDSFTGEVGSSGTELLSGSYPYGVEFSPKSKKLYVTTNKYVTNRGVTSFEGSSLYQYDLESVNIPQSRKEIRSSTMEQAGALQLAMNGKIYRAIYNLQNQMGGDHLAAINKPELDGNSCGYESNAISLAGGSSSNYGLPPSIANLFKLTFEYEFTCLGQETYFYLTTDETFEEYLWDFGDGLTSTDREPYHEFLNPGEYEVTLYTKSFGFSNKPIKKTIEIIGSVEVMDTPYELVQCDTDENSEDGLAQFNLQLANDPISLGKGFDVDVYYYKDEEALEADIENENALYNFYYNNLPREILYAKVVPIDSDCYGVAQVILEARKTVIFDQSMLIGCNIGNSTGVFNLNAHQDVIKHEANLEASSDVSFYKSEDDAILGLDPLPDEYESKAKTIFFRVENDNICYGSGELVLDVYEFPRILQREEMDICSTSFPINIDAGIDSSERLDFNYEWENGLTTHDREISTVGEYKVIVTNNTTQCNVTRTVIVNIIEEPEILDVEIKDNLGSYTATIKVRGGINFLYGLNNDFGIYRNNPEFTNLTPGVYTAYVSDLNSCYIVEKQFYIFGFPKFFTPNSDGYNDHWEIKGLNYDLYTYSDVHVFDRFGKLLATFKVDSNWNGTYNGNYLPPDDYWFTVTVTDDQNIQSNHTGHFSIVR